MVNVSWLINGTEVQTNESVTEASYTNTSPTVGTWNITAIASNENGTGMQTWVWNVSQQVTPTPSPIPIPTPTPGTPSPSPLITPTPTPTPSPMPIQILSSNAKPSTPFFFFGFVYDKGGECRGPVVYITNTNTSQKWEAETTESYNYYQFILYTTNISVGDMLQINATKNGTLIGNATHTVNQTEIKRGVIEMSINEVWTLPDLIIFDISTPPLIDNESNTIEVTIRNDGTASSGPFNVTFSVKKCENETEYENETRVSGLERDSHVSTNFTWMPPAKGCHNITVSVDSKNEVKELNESNNNLSKIVFVGVPDFRVTNITFNPPPPEPLWIGDVVKINATIANTGAKEGTTNVVFYDNKSIEIKRTEDDYSGGVAINDTITLPGIRKLKVHFSRIGAFSDIKIYDKNNSEIGKFEFPSNDIRDYWTKWCYGDTIRIESRYANFTVDRYEALIENKSIPPLAARNSTDVSADWNLSDQYMGWATSGEHNITVIVDPYDEIVESDETNNNRTKMVVVNASVDFAVTNISFNVTNVSFNRTEPLLDDTVEINATVKNFGDRNGTTFVEIYYDNRSIEIEREGTSTDNIFLPAGVLGARLHFDYFSVPTYASITIYDKNGKLIEDFGSGASGKDYWTDCIYSDVITINSSESSYGKPNFKIDRYEALILNEPVTLNASENKTVSVDWIANTTCGGAGPHNISVEIDSPNSIVETCETNNTLIEQIFVNGTDLSLTNIEIPCGDPTDPTEDFCYRQQDVHINITLANLGALNVTNFTVFFKDGRGEGNKSGINTTFFPPNRFIPLLKSGENRSINVTWTPSESGKHTITISLPFDNTDTNKTNNERFENVSVKSNWDFSVENVSVDLDPEGEGVSEGEPVNITATVSNLGLKSGNVSVGFYVNSIDFVGSEDDSFIGINATDVYVGVNETNTTSISWNANIPGGDHLIVVVVDPDDLVDEWPDDTRKIGDSIILKGNRSITGNNVKNRTLHVITSQLNITNLIIQPTHPVIGDKVNVTAVVENEGSEHANSTVWFYMEKNESISCDIPPRVHPVGAHYSQTWSVSQPECLPMRVHFEYIEIKKEPESNPPQNTTEEATTDDVINAYVDAQPVSFYVKSKDVADGQPIKVPQIDFNTPCDKCKVKNLDLVCIDKRWEDVWTEWSDGNEIEVNVDLIIPFNLGFLIDKYQVRLGNRTITIDAGESKPYNIKWNTSSPLEFGNYTLVANVEDMVVRNETFVSETDLAVTNVSVKEEVMDGDQVRINATIKNIGRKNATAFFVNFSEVYVPEEREEGISLHVYNHSELINVTHRSLGAGNSTNISFVLWNASIRDIICNGSEKLRENVWEDCNWTEIADNYLIRVEINPLDNVDKDETNNCKEVKVHVNRSRDFSITNLLINETLAPPHDRVNLTLDELVTLNATLNIINLANSGGNISVGFYLDDKKGKKHLINNTFVNGTFGKGNGTVYAELDWRIENFAGDHNLTVVADPENEIHEINESNNASTWQIHVKAPELTITNISFDPERPEKGETVKINVTIENHGDKNACNVTLSIYDWADRHIKNVASIEEYSGFPWIEVKRGNATAMRLYLDLNISKGGEVCIYNSKGEQIKPPSPYSESFHGWTPWVLGNNITVVTKRNETSSAYAKVSKIYYLEPKPGEFNTTIHDLVINENKTITVNWTAPTNCSGERLIAAIIDHKNNVTEYDESNNTKAGYISVQTKDIGVSNLSLRWSNGALINDTIKIKDGDNITIAANVTNNGIEEADIRFLVDDIVIKEEPGLSLVPNESKIVYANWTAEVGIHVLKVEADYGNNIVETNETNNIVAKERYICGAEVTGNESWETFGLRGEIDTIIDKGNRTQPYDEDEVNITVNITNSGYVDASDFNMLLFYDYTPKSYHYTANQIIDKNETEIYPGAEWVYLRIIDRARKEEPGKWNPMDAGDVEVYDGLGNVILNKTNFNDTCHCAEVREGKSCWIPVEGNTTNVRLIVERNEDFIVYLYPIYKNETSRLFEGINVPVNGSYNVSMNRTVSVGNFTIMAVIDPENRVPEDNKADNIITEEIVVLPTRDFTVTNVTAAVKSNLSDSDTTNITAKVANVGYRNETTRVSFVDYENETRIHKYYFDNKSLNLSYLPISPDTYVSADRRNLTIIRRPGVDAIQLRFSQIKLESYASPIPKGKIWICKEVCDEYNEDIFGMEYDDDDAVNTIEDKNIWVSGDTAYIYTEGRASFSLSGYTTRKEFHEEENVSLKNATRNESGNITVWPKDITAMWNASTGDHDITVIIDPGDETSEINETNNTYILPLHVNASKELEIVALNITPLHPTDGEEVNITAVVQNKGNRSVNSSFDLWMDALKDSSAAPVPYYNWSITKGGKKRYIVLLNHTELSLAPGESEPLNATWEGISVYGNPTYIVRAIVDPLDEIDEINESNNEMSPEIVMNYSDLTVTGFNSPTNKTNASVIIENIGADNATNVTVMLELTKRKKREPPLTGGGSQDIMQEGAVRMRIRFLSLDTTAEGAYFDIYGIEKDGKRYREKEYSGVKIWNEWTPWIEGDTIYIDYNKAEFCIDEYKWGDVNTTTIEYFDVSKSENVSLPARWNKYEGPAILNVTVDPNNNIPEQKECNNNKTARIYVDLMSKGIEFVHDEEGELSGIYATFLNNDKAFEEGKGIAFPAFNFNVSLSGYSYTIQKRTDENGTVYGGEEREVWFGVNESTFAANKTYPLIVLIDSEDEIDEINEKNNNCSTLLGPDISVDEIYTELIQDGSCNCKVGAVIKNEGNLRATDFLVRLYLNSTTGNETWDGKIKLPLCPNKEIKLPFSYAKVYSNRFYNVTVVADPENTVEELNEWNNEKPEETIGPDVTIEDIKFYNKIGNEVDSDKLIVTEEHTINVEVKNKGKVSAEGFEVEINITNVTLSPYIEPIQCLGPNATIFVPFDWTPSRGGYYNVTAEVDRNGNVPELDETNNNMTIYSVKAGEPNYKAQQEPLHVIPGNELNGGMYYEIRGTSNTIYGESYSYPTTFYDIPNGVEFARLYLYIWGCEDHVGGKWDPGKLPDVEVYFNNNHDPEPEAARYEEYPGATSFNLTYATIGYVVEDSDVQTGGTLEVRADFTNTTDAMPYEMSGMGLVVVYHDADAPLMKYYIGEGGDVIMAKNNAYKTGFEYSDCTREVIFNGIMYPELANATLITVLAPYNFYDPIETYKGELLGDLLLFNDKDVGDLSGRFRTGPIYEANGEGHYWRHYTIPRIALTKNGERGEYVDVQENNLAKIQSRGNYFFLTNAFLNVTYPPDLEPSLEKVPQKVAVGKQYYVDITNIGRSNAEDFYVHFYVDGEELIDKKQHVGIIEGVESSQNWEELPFPWTAPITKVGQRVELKIAVDPENNVTEFDETNNNATKNVSVALGELIIPPLHPGGRGGGTGGGWGMGTGTGEGSGEGEGTGTGGAGGEGAVGESGGEAITGRLMKGIVAQSEEGGGGGKGEFSLLGLLLRLAMLAAAVALVCAGYLLERRRQNHKQ